MAKGRSGKNRGGSRAGRPGQSPQGVSSGGRPQLPRGIFPCSPGRGVPAGQPGEKGVFPSGLPYPEGLSPLVTRKNPFLNLAAAVERNALTLPDALAALRPLSSQIPEVRDALHFAVNEVFHESVPFPRVDALAKVLSLWANLQGDPLLTGQIHLHAGSCLYLRPDPAALSAAADLLATCQILFPKTHKLYSISLYREGMAHCQLADQGQDPEKHLEQGLELLRAAQYRMERGSAAWATALSQEAKARTRLFAYQPENAALLEAAMAQAVEASRYFPEGSEDWADCLTTESTAHLEMVGRWGLDEEHLERALELTTAAGACFPTGSPLWGAIRMNQAITHMKLARRGWRSLENAEAAVKLFAEIEPVFPRGAPTRQIWEHNRNNARLLRAELQKR
ncbi:MAG: hypothetical protein FJX77_17595, partial [Armatimonadetes bacterium]|nr:hypothetical protein [Armatimonadota bacterium]